MSKENDPVIEVRSCQSHLVRSGVARLAPRPGPTSALQYKTVPNSNIVSTVNKGTYCHAQGQGPCCPGLGYATASTYNCKRTETKYLKSSKRSQTKKPKQFVQYRPTKSFRYLAEQQTNLVPTAN